MAKLTEMVDGMTVSTGDIKKKMSSPEVCSDCVVGKMSRDPRQSSSLV